MKISKFILFSLVMFVLPVLSQGANPTIQLRKEILIPKQKLKINLGNAKGIPASAFEIRIDAQCFDNVGIFRPVIKPCNDFFRKNGSPFYKYIKADKEGVFTLPEIIYSVGTKKGYANLSISILLSKEGRKLAVKEYSNGTRDQLFNFTIKQHLISYESTPPSKDTPYLPLEKAKKLPELTLVRLPGEWLQVRGKDFSNFHEMVIRSIEEQKREDKKRGPYFSAYYDLIITADTDYELSNSSARFHKITTTCSDGDLDTIRSFTLKGDKIIHTPLMGAFNKKKQEYGFWIPPCLFFVPGDPESLKNVEYISWLKFSGSSYKEQGKKEKTDKFTSKIPHALLDIYLQ